MHWSRARVRKSGPLFPVWRVGREVLCVAVAFELAVAQNGHAQQAASQPVLAEAPGFTGKTATLETTGYSVGRRIFAPGSHNATWHMHTAGQLVFAEAGHGRLQIKGQPARELAPGDSGYIPANTMHWHGSVPTESFTMMFITMGASTTSQGEPLTEEVYLGKK
jgi:quercetin dioxygenase-like cupin family protein